MKEKQGHWYVVRMPLHEVNNLHRLSEINGKTFMNRIELSLACDDLGIKDTRGYSRTICLERLSSRNKPSSGDVTFPCGHAEIRVFLSLE